MRLAIPLLAFFLAWLPVVGVADDGDRPGCGGLSAKNTGDARQRLGRGREYLRQGRYCLALAELQGLAAGGGAQAGPEPRARALGMLGQAYHRMRYGRLAEGALNTALALDAGGAQERARWTAELADVLAEEQSPEAGQMYGQALALAGGDKSLRAFIRLGQAGLAPRPEQAGQLAGLGEDIAAVDDAGERAALRIKLAGQAAGLGPEALGLAYASYAQAARDAAGNPRLEAEALDGLAQLYEDQKRPDESLRLNSQAVRAAQAVDAHDLLAGLLWRQGRLHEALGQEADALAAYQGAVDNIEAIRADIPVEYTKGRSSFRDTLAPVYQALADLQLRRAGREGGAENQRWLYRARATVELIKQAELEDFLGGRCTVQSAKIPLEQVRTDADTAILYPLVLPGRLELLLSSGDEIRQYSLPVGAEELEAAAKSFAALVHARQSRPGDLKASSKRLHDWLIAPLQPWLEQHPNLKTLLFVPDGALRLVPPAALYDGGRYLVERYALAISPGLTLSSAAPPRLQDTKALLAGLSEPGLAAEKLPQAILRDLLGGTRGLEDPARAAEFESLRKTPAFNAALRQKLALPGVAPEIEKLRAQLPRNTTLMDQGFTVDNFGRQFAREPYAIVHIASHGKFGGSPRDSFILAYDGFIDMDALESLLKAGAPRHAPAELLTLSACQTAEGDDRAPLGLSGVAIKARVRSVLGSLWPVADEAAARLMAEFYQALAQPGTGKAEALRQAQRALLKDPRFQHPYFWSPFILAGSWL